MAETVMENKSALKAHMDNVRVHMEDPGEDMTGLEVDKAGSEACRDRDHILRADGLKAGYGKHVVVGGLELAVSAGEIVTLIGPNGSGKSTILRTVSGSLAALGGAVYVSGRELGLYGRMELARKLSVLLTRRQNPELMTCQEVCETGRYPYTGRFGRLTGEDRRIVRESLEAMHAQDIAGEAFAEISDGQRQLVMLARAICQQPELLILDEPTSYLDISRKLELLSLLRELVSNKNIAVLMSLHEVDLAQKVSDRIVCIKDGCAVCSGSPEEVFAGDTVRDLYGIAYGSYCGSYGSAELNAVKGEPSVFVIGGGGGGIPVYRRLQRRGEPFAAGIIAENDIEFPAASALATRLVAARAFEPVGDDEVSEALGIIGKCRLVINCVHKYGTMNEACRALAAAAERCGRLEEA